MFGYGMIDNTFEIVYYFQQQEKWARKTEATNSRVKFRLPTRVRFTSSSLKKG
jgi:hypothetical protein